MTDQQLRDYIEGAENRRYQDQSFNRLLAYWGIMIHIDDKSKSKLTPESIAPLLRDNATKAKPAISIAEQRKRLKATFEALDKK